MKNLIIACTVLAVLCAAPVAAIAWEQVNINTGLRGSLLVNNGSGHISGYSGGYSAGKGIATGSDTCINGYVYGNDGGAGLKLSVDSYGYAKRTCRSSIAEAGIRSSAGACSWGNGISNGVADGFVYSGPK